MNFFFKFFKFIIQAPSIFDPKKWIDLFPHNETHANIEFANETLSLSWEDALVYFIHLF